MKNFIKTYFDFSKNENFVYLTAAAVFLPYPLAILLLLISLFVFGGETTKDFVLIIVIGTVQGLFSSVCLAGSFLYEITRFYAKKSGYEQIQKKNRKLQPAD